MASRLYNRFWVGATIVLTAIFVVLFFPIAHAKYGAPTSILLTAVGAVVIWMSYLVRAYVFTRGESDGSTKNGR